MTQKEINEAVKISLDTYGKNATLEALNKMYHSGMITLNQCIKALDIINK